jgi:hypothetical protein
MTNKRDKKKLPKANEVDRYCSQMNCVKVIFPDGEISFIGKNKGVLGGRWDSPYWGEIVMVTEITEDQSVCWVEPIN